MRRWLLPALLLMLAVTALPARALESNKAVTERDTVSLVSNVDSYAPGKAFRVGLHFRLQPGWHIYYKDPGDAGLPPEVKFDLPPGATVGPIDWPPYQHLKEGPLNVNAYEGDVLLPVQVTPPSGTAALPVVAHVSWLVCKNICVPEQADFRMSLPSGTAAPSADAALFGRSAAPAKAPAPLPVPLGQALLFAFLGGLILNLMPCVFPVLAMKALGLAKLGGAARREIRFHAAFYTLGVLAAFLVLGLLLLSLRSAGTAAGWGFQFASPGFVAVMTWLLFAIGLNLSGAFQVGGGLIGAGQSLTSRGGHAGSFLTGVLAVIVATPCTAPFMGVALAAAFAAPGGLMLGILLVMGAGLALPYAALAVFPRAVALLPAPGRWMEVLKQALAFPMYAAVVWLLWVMSQETGSSGVLGTTSGLVLIGFAAWAYGLAQYAEGQPRQLGFAAALAGILAAGAVLPGIAAAPPAAPSAEASAGEPFSQARLDALRAEGRPVFVNMTAAWCVTCLVNERVALAPQAVQDAFMQYHVAYLKGDWTRQDPAITKYLRAHGRDGVPLYVFYPPGGAQPVVLPQILTPKLMLETLATGQGKIEARGP